jgi:hypothetical protein
VLENARALLKSQLPAHLFKKLDPNSIQPAKETFLAADEYENRLDQLYTARMLNGTQVWIYLLLEHKSWVDRRIALQLLKYVLRIHEWLDRNGRPPQVVIPLVVYHGEKVWDEPTSMIYLCSVLDSQNLELLEFAFQAGQLPQSEKKMPNCLEALLERGLLIGRIRTLQQVLAQPAMTSQDSLLLSLEELQTLAAKLESQLNLD